MPTFRIEDEKGRWLTDMRLNASGWEAGDAIYQGSDKLEVVEVRLGGEKTTLVVRASERAT
jgi:hypothetical protein